VSNPATEALERELVDAQKVLANERRCLEDARLQVANYQSAITDSEALIQALKDAIQKLKGD